MIETLLKCDFMAKYERIVENMWDFRTANTKEYTHCYHTYPAMMIPQVARTLITRYMPKDGCKTLLDPYAGSGTSLVEACILGINSIGTDLNPLARFLCKVKTTHYDEKLVAHAFEFIKNSIACYSEEKVKNKDFSRISNYTFWYSEKCLLELSYLSQLIAECKDSIRDFFSIALSETVREVSFTRNGEFKRFKMSEKSLAKFNPNVFKLFEEKVQRNIEGLISFNQKAHNTSVAVYSFNSTNGIPTELIRPESIDIVVTSPPYGDSHTTVAYGQFSRWANEWFGFEHAHDLDRLLMGGGKSNQELFSTETIREVLDSIREKEEKRYWEVVSFLNDYYQSIQNVAATIRKGGVVCYVVGNRTVKGIQIPLDYFTAEAFEKFGLTHQTTIVRAIPNKRMPSKTSPTNIAGDKVQTMSNEYIVILKK